ncbi:MAG: hypothetical protein RL425_294 [Pseudomonadota bacterium]|jgi:uncharacterized protein (TIGR02001 family)
MRATLRQMALASLALPAFLAATPALAQDEETGPLDISFSIAAVSDYRFRGVSLSNGDPAIQPSLTVSHESGLYASLWGSNIANNDGDDIEIDATIGLSKEVGSLTLNAGGIYYIYPGASEYDYAELFGSVGTDIGKANVTVNVTYAPSQDNIGNQDNIYVGVAATHPLGDIITLNGAFGIEDGAFGDSKRDWSIGADVDGGNGFVIGIKYVDTARTQSSSLTNGTALFSISKAF